MLKWVGNLLGRSNDLPEGVPKAWVERLQQQLEPLDSPLAEELLAYVLHGEPLAPLATLSMRDDASTKLGLTSFGRDQSQAAAALYEPFDEVPAAAALRWAKVLEASAGPQAPYCQLAFERDVHWPELLLVHSSGSAINSWTSERPKAQSLSATRLESLCIEDGLAAPAWLLGGFRPARSGYFNEQRTLLLTDVAGYPEALLRHADALAPLLLQPAVATRVHALKMLAPAPAAALDLWAPQLAELAASGSKQVRAAAEPLVQRAGTAVVAALRELAVQAKPEVRLQALRLLAELARRRSDDALLTFARDTAAADKAPAVQALPAEWDAHAQTPVDVSYSYELPTIDWSASANAVAPEVLARLWQEANAAIDKANAQHREWHAKSRAQGHTWALSLDEPFKASDADALARQLRADGPATAPGKLTVRHHNLQRFLGPVLTKLAKEGHFTPAALAKTLAALGFIDPDSSRVDHVPASCFTALHRATGHPTLLELAELLKAHHVPAERVMRSYCASWGASLAGDWPDADVWPFFAHHQDVLMRLLAELNSDWHFSRDGLFKAVATLPAPPPALVNMLFDLALGSAKGDRALAQEALKNQPGKETRITAALASGKAEVRTVAAQWLGRLRHEPAVPALEQAVRKEKHDVAKGALLDALQALGRPVEHYLDRDALDKDATKALAKGVPADLAWFPFAALPAVHWADTGAAVPPATLQWLVVQAFKQKSPEPNAVLRKLCGLMDVRDREALGQFVLEAWMAEDVRPGTHDEALKLARDAARGQWHSMQNYAQYYQGNPQLHMTEDELTAHFLPGFLRQPVGSAAASKGLLAVAAACCAERAAPPVQRYLKAWYGTRASQGKSLIAMLAWIEHPSATQLMLSIGSRFRTKSFQEEATKQAEALAERKGWSLAELADRTIPSAGFDETGTLTLSYGQRAFTARLLPDFKVELFNPDGKKITALPEPRQDDDQALAKDAKKALGAAKKELKSIVELQTDRLYEALCTGRGWPAADWADYLQQHPVLRHLVQRLVWIETPPDGAPRVFRPLDDGSLTDVHDDPVELTAGATIRLAHDSLLGAEQVAAWQQHLADYDIKPLFQQFGKGRYALPADKADATQVLDFHGHLIETFALRGRATKLGYTRGSTEDGGWFFGYEKRFPTLGLLATIEFTGNGLPEENRTVALLNLSFAATGEGDRWSRTAQPLAKVPQVLLSECYDDLRLLAAEGTGFDADWEKKSAC